MSSELRITKLKHASSSSNNLVLGSDGSATATLSSTSVVPASIGGAMSLIEKATASNSTSIEFTGINLLTQYRHLVFYVHNIVPASDNGEFIVRVATVGTSYDADTSHYRNTNQRNYWDGSTRNGAFTSYSNSTSFFGHPGNLGNQQIDDDFNASDGGFNSVMTFFNAPHDVHYHFGVHNSVFGSEDGYIINYSGGGQYILNDDAFTAIQFSVTGRNIASGSIAMYGIKDA